MTRYSTAFVMTASATIGPWGDDRWRVGKTAQLVEGGSGAHWLTAPAGYSDDGLAPQSMLIDTDSARDRADATVVAKSLVLLLATNRWNAEDQLQFTGSGMVTSGEDGRSVSRNWKLSIADAKRISKSLSEDWRIGVVRLEEESCLDSNAIAILRSWGLKVDEYFQSSIAAL